MFIQNKYSLWYNSIIQNAKLRNNNDGYIERHHIIPRSLGGNNSIDNIVTLTAKEHFICHLLLTKMTEGVARSKMIFAFVAMSRSSNTQERYNINSRLFESVKKQRIHTIESRKKMSVAATGRKQTMETVEKRVSKFRGRVSPIKGKSIHSEESKQVISEKQKKLLALLTPEENAARIKNSCSSPNSWTDDRRSKISKAITGIKRSEETRKKISAASKNRSIEQKLKCGIDKKGKTWKLIDGKRVWLDKENKNF